MKKSSLVRVAVLLGACILAVVAVTACGGSTGGGNGGGGSVNRPIQVTTSIDILHTDPALGYDTLSWPVEHAVFTTLITYNKTGQGLVPWAATSVPKGQDGGKKYIFTIRKGMKFTDGEPVDAQAFKYEIERILNPNTKSSLAGFYTNIVGAKEYRKNRKGDLKGVKVLSPYKMEFDLVEPSQTFLQTMAIPSASAVPRKAVEKAGPAFDTHPVGNGPMKVKNFTRGSEMVLVKNPDYKNPSGNSQTTAAKSGEIDMTIGLDPTTEIERVQNGSSDYSLDFPASQFANLKSEPHFENYIKTQVGNNVHYLYMDVKQKPFDNPKVREAMQYAIDKQRIAQIFAGEAAVANEILPPNMPGYDESIKGYPYDPSKAKALLKEAGYPNGFTIDFWDQNSQDEPKIDQVIQYDLSQIGVKMTLHSVSLDEWFNETDSGKTQVGVGSWYQDFPDPSDFLDVLFNSAQIPVNNYSHYSDKTTDTMLAQALVEQNRGERLAMYQKIQKRILADNPVVPLFNTKSVAFCNPKLEGDYIHPVWGPVYQNWYLTR